MTTSILFVCMGNICRSPTARGLFDRAFARAGLAIETDSAGTIDFHVGHRPDSRAIEHALSHGVDISADLARCVVPADFYRFDRILVMDRSNLRDVQDMAPVDASARIELIMQLAPEYGLSEVPDPYYGGDEGFVRVIDMLQSAADRLVGDLLGRQRAGRVGSA